MTIFNTKEMDDLLKIFTPYMNEHHQLPDDVPEEIKYALEEYRRLAREQEEFALSL